MRIALVVLCLLACLTLSACGGGGGGNGGNNAPENQWDVMDWDTGEWA